VTNKCLLKIRAIILGQKETFILKIKKLGIKLCGPLFYSSRASSNTSYCYRVHCGSGSGSEASGAGFCRAGHRGKRTQGKLYTVYLLPHLY
jgi:hypothetical protein